MPACHRSPRSRRSPAHRRQYRQAAGAANEQPIGRIVASDCYIADTALTTISHYTTGRSWPAERHSSPRRHPCRPVQKPNLRTQDPRRTFRLLAWGSFYASTSGETYMARQGPPKYCEISLSSQLLRKKPPVLHKYSYRPDPIFGGFSRSAVLCFAKGRKLSGGVVWSLLRVLSGNLRAGFCFAVALVLVLAGCAEKNFVPGSPMARLFGYNRAAAGTPKPPVKRHPESTPRRHEDLTPLFLPM